MRLAGGCRSHDPSHSKMKTPRVRLRVAITLTALLASLAVQAQERRSDGERRPEGERGREGGNPRVNPLFAALDTNGDGVIDAKEMENAPAALKKLDRNGDGRITEDEVLPAFGGRGGPGGPGQANVDDVVARMLQMDKNGDGKLSLDELPERMAGMMERGDLNKDGFLTRDELVKLARAQSQRGAPGGERGGDRPRNDDERR